FAAFFVLALAAFFAAFFPRGLAHPPTAFGAFFFAVLVFLAALGFFTVLRFFVAPVTASATLPTASFTASTAFFTTFSAVEAFFFAPILVLSAAVCLVSSCACSRSSSTGKSATILSPDITRTLLYSSASTSLWKLAAFQTLPSK